MSVIVKQGVEVSNVHAGKNNLYAVNLVTLERSVPTTFLKENIYL